MSSALPKSPTKSSGTVRGRLLAVTITLTMWVVGTTAFVLTVWFLIGRVLQSEVGLEVYDEALHILAASHGFESATFYHQFPWSWHTRPFFLVAGSDITTFRTLGGFILFLSAFFLGFGIERLGSRYSAFPRAKGISFRWAISIGLVLGVSSFTYYSGMLRSPSYNWVSLVGFVIALNGLLFFLSIQNQKTSGTKRKILPPLLSVGLFSVGAFLTLPARPTTAIYLLIFSSLLVVIYGRRNIILTWIMASITWLTFFVGTAIAIGLWPNHAVGVLVQAATRERASDYNFFTDCSIDASIGLRGAIETLVCVPETFFADLAGRTTLQVALLSVSIMAIACFREFIVKSLAARCFAMAMITTIGLWISVGESFSGFEYEPAQRWALMTEQVTGVLLMWAGSIILLAREPNRKASRWPWVLLSLPALGTIWGLRLDLIPERFGISLGFSWLALVCFLALLRGSRKILSIPPSNEASNFQLNRPDQLFWLSLSVVGGSFVLGFGSSLGAYRLATITLVLVFAATLLIVTSPRTQQERLVGTTWIAIASTILSFVVVRDGHNQPWNNPPFGHQATITQVIPGKASLLLDEATSQTLTRLTEKAMAEGWTTETPILDYTRWGVLLPLILGANVVPTLTLSLNWNTLEAERNFELADYQGFNFDSAWIGISHHENMTDLDHDLQEAMIELGEKYTRLSFPADYELVAGADGFELWAPIKRN